jgi:endonuclease YncB( thermonuclease family)
MHARSPDPIASKALQSIKSGSRLQTAIASLAQTFDQFHGEGENMKRMLLPLAMLAVATPVAAKAITGPAKVLDDQVLEIDGRRIMLFGIDSVMRKQACMLDGKLWNCWEAAVRNLQILADQGPATCDPVGDPDVYGRILARCTINGKSLNEQLVREGWAVARSSETTDYVAAEAAAKKEKLGLWQGRFQPPDQFRVSHGIFVDRP